ncbi:nucleolar protein 10-like [Schistocerca gregaria]|uniref:nucleolar protein 10-like n=1 Tax=Schistocerca gregaria TaxID=7010 RepID=UPI00211E2AA7|nr:nucleolar protein 10-like [Schistocerca gregaria]
MEILDPNGIKIYNISAGKSIPQWILERKKEKPLKISDKDQLELIQDFGFPTAATKIKQSEDGQCIMAAGVYPPMIKVFSTSDLCLKFKRHMDADIVQFKVLSPDFSKMAFLRADRILEFHAKFGTYYKTRLPNFCSDLAYQYASCDLFAVGTSPDIYRFNLQQGRFLKPFSTGMNSIQSCTINPAFGILAAGDSLYNIECWDSRDRSHLASMKINSEKFFSNNYLFKPSVTGITALKFSENGLTLAVGTSTGHCLLYDIRSNIPYHVKDHQFDVPITSIHFHETTKNVVSSCKKIVRVWHRDTGASFFNIEPGWDIHDTSVVNDTGMLLIAGESPKMNVYYVPELGRPPIWARFLENITEELEPDQQKYVYQDYKFVTREELERLGIEKLIGTPYLRGYMHGYFIHAKLYSKLYQVAKPDKYEEYLKKQVQERLEAKRAGRVSLTIPQQNSEVKNLSNSKTTSPELAVPLKESQVNSKNRAFLASHPKSSTFSFDERNAESPLSGSYSQASLPSNSSQPTDDIFEWNKDFFYPDFGSKASHKEYISHHSKCDLPSSANAPRLLEVTEDNFLAPQSLIRGQANRIHTSFEKRLCFDEAKHGDLENHREVPMEPMVMSFTSEPKKKKLKQLKQATSLDRRKRKMVH